MNGRFWSALRVSVVAALVLQLALPPAPLRAQVAGSSATLAAMPTTAFDGDTVTLSGTVISRAAGTTFLLDFGDGTTTPIATPASLNTASPFSFTHVYAAPLQSAIAVVRIASAAGTSAGARAAVTLSAGGITGPAGTVTMGVSANFTVTASGLVFPAGNFSIAWGDGSAPTTAPVVASQAVAHAFANPGNFTVSLLSPAGAKIATTQVSVAPLNLTITVQTNPIQAGAPTGILFFGGTPNGSGTVSVAFGDGATTTFPYAARTQIFHAYARPGTYTVTGSIGGTSVATATVTAVMASLTLATNPNPSLAGNGVTVATTATIPAGATPPPTLTLDYGDGSATTSIPFSTAQYSHAYAARGTFVLKATDPASGTQYATATQMVLSPGAMLSATNGSVGQPVNITVGVTALGAQTGPNLVVNFGDGSATQTIPYASTTLTHAYATGGTFTITVSPLSANAGVGAPYATTTSMITAPSVALATSPNPSLVGASISLNVTTMGVFINAPPPITINFGDGSATQTIPFASTTIAHTFTTPGTFTVTVSNPNAAQLASTTQRVVAPSATLSVTPNPVNVGTPASIALGVGALGGPAGPSLVLNFGDGSAPQTVPYAAATFPHAYATAGTYSVTATPVGGAAPLATASVTVNSPATATLSSGQNPALAGTGVPITVTATGAGPATYLTLNFGDGTSQTVPFATGTFTHTYASAGTYTVTTGPVGGGTLATLSQTIVAPGATLGLSPSPATVGQAVTANIGVTPLGNLAGPNLAVSFGDGSALQTLPYAASAPTHVYTAAGTYTVTVTAAGSAAPLASSTITVTAAASTLTLTSSQNPALTGSALTFTATASTGILGLRGVTIAFGDGTTAPIGGGTATHAYAAAGTYAVSLFAPASNAPAFTLTQTIVAPGATIAAAPNPTTVGTSTAFTLGVTPLAGIAGPGLTVSFGDNTAPSTVPYAATTLNHTYAAAGTYTATLTGPAGAQFATTSVTVQAPSNVNLASSPNPSFVGAPVGITLTTTGAGTGALTIAFGDGATQVVPFASASLSHVYTAAGTFTISASGANGAPLATVTQTVVKPSATLVPSQNPGLQGSPISFALGVGAIGSATPPSLTVNYGDGTVPVTVPYAAASLSHTFTTTGQFTVVVTAAGTATPLATVAVTILTPMVTLSATPNPQFAGTPLTVGLTVNSIPNGIAPTLVINYGDGSAPANVPFAAGSFAHTYLVAGQFTVTASAPGGGAPLFSLPVRIVSPTATLSATPNPVLAGVNVNLALGVGSLFGLTGPNLVVSFGDGSAPQTVPYASATLTHAFRAAGTYPVGVTPVGSTTLLATAQVTVMAPMATLAITPNPQLVGSPVSIALTATSLAVNAPNLTLDFGDGSATQTIPYGSQTVAHTYGQTGTFTVRATDPTGAVNATASVQIVAPSATLMIAPNPVMLGKATGVTVMVGNIGTLPGPSPLTVEFGDGAQQQIGYATATIQHTYAAVGRYTVSVSGLFNGQAVARGTAAKAYPATIFATSVVTVVAQTQNLTVMAPTVTTGSPAQILVTLTPPGGFSANPVLLLFGDGTSTTVRATGLYPHAYGAPGIYTVALQSLTNGATLATSQLTVNGIAPRVPIGQIYGTTFTLSPVLAGDVTQVLVQFSVAVPTLANTADPIEAFVDLLTTKGKLVRRSDLFEILPSAYSGPGVKTVKIPYDTPLDAAGTYLVKVTLMSAQGGTIVTGPPATLIIIGGPDPLPKIQTDFHSTGAIEVGPHAGQPGVTFDPSISNGLIFPTYAIGITGLFDPVSRRSDPVFNLKSGAQQVVRGPDATPPPAVSATAGPAVGATEPGAPIPTPPGPLNGGAISGANAYNGALSKATAVPDASATGAAAPAPATPIPIPVPASSPGAPVPGASGTAAPGGVASPMTGSSAQPSGMATASGNASTSSTGSTGIFGPATAAAPGGTAPAPPPDAGPQPAHPYQGVYGRGQATLPALLGGGTTLRGIDIVDSAGPGPTTYQVGYGDTIVGTPTTSAQHGTIADIARSFGNGGVARVAFFGRQDDPVTYATTPSGTGPLVADSEVVEFTSPALGPLTFTATGALSSAHSLSQLYRVDDASDKFTLAFQKPAYNFSFDYHNAGGFFAVGAGPSAAADRVGFASASTIQLFTVASLALGYTKDSTRSAFSRQSDAFATMNFTLPAQQTLQIGVRRDTQLTPTTDTTSDSGTFNLGGHLGIATVSLNGSLAATRDYINAINGTTTRTLSAQFAVQQNAHALGIGINATDLSGASPNETIGESLTYGFPFLGHIVNGALLHGIELQLSATNTSTHSPFSGAADESLAAILSYHLNQHLAVGVRPEFTWHQDGAKVGNTKASALRLRLDLTQ